MPHPTPSESQTLRAPVAGEERQKAVVCERMLRRFKVWLEEVLESEALPQGLDAEILAQLQAEEEDSGNAAAPVREDLHTLWSALVTLTEETRLQGRAFKQLHDDLPPMNDLAASVIALLPSLNKDRAQQEQECLVQARSEIFKGVMDTVLDCRDRLEHGLKTARTCMAQMPKAIVASAPRYWWQRRKPPEAPSVDTGAREATDALIQGCTLALERMDESLERWHVKPIVCLDQPFDPNTMKAVDMERRSDVTQGTVLEVYRTGYLWNKKVHRVAEVKVAKENDKEVSHGES